MLKVNFTVVFDKNGDIEEVTRNCRIPRPDCKGCKFKKWCDRVESKIKEKRR